MLKEFSDPIHELIKVDHCEVEVINSLPLQRLRFIKQLGVAYLVFPSAQHTRFEHSLGTMELAGKICQKLGIKDSKLLRIFRLAGLLHDIGHTPFSHTTEVFLGDRSHESLGEHVLYEEGIADILKKHGFSEEDICLISSLAFKKESSLPKVITGEFGADRLDYLRRDAYFCGTSYGFFDYGRLLENILLIEGIKCVHISALRSLESFVIGRYFMYSQVYFHKVVRILNLHLKEVLEDLLNRGYIEPENFHRKTDAHIIDLMLHMAHEEKVRRVLFREHFREVFSTGSREVFEFVKNKLLEVYGKELLRFDTALKRVLDEDIPLWDERNLLSFKEVSHIVANLKDIEIYRIYAHPAIREEAKKLVYKLT